MGIYDFSSSLPSYQSDFLHEQLFRAWKKFLQALQIMRALLQVVVIASVENHAL